MAVLAPTGRLRDVREIGLASNAIQRLHQNRLTQLAREGAQSSVNVRVIPTGVAIAGSVDLAYELYNCVFRRVPRALEKRVGFDDVQPEGRNRDARTSRVRQLLHVSADAEPAFGYKPRVPLKSQRLDCAEVDLRLGNLLIEAKLTEYDFQRAALELIRRYARFEQVFDQEHPDVSGNAIESYQLFRGVLAADRDPDTRFCVLCDARRPDLIERWHSVMRLVVPYDLRCRLLLLTWQELGSVLPSEVQAFLAAKYGILAGPS